MGLKSRAARAELTRQTLGAMGEEQQALTYLLTGAAGRPRPRPVWAACIDRNDTCVRQNHFLETARRITDNLSVQRDRRDKELFEKVGEVISHAEEFRSGRWASDGGTNDFDQI